MTTHIAWTDIDNFYTVRRTLQKYPELLNGNSVVTYCAKVKLHGTNAGVRISSKGEVTAMSRTSVITPQNDNAGFAAWVHARADKFAMLAPVAGLGDFVIFGEWCGPGIQKGVAINQIPERTFAIFAARQMSTLHPGETVEFTVDPQVLKIITTNIPGVRVIDWYTYPDAPHNGVETFMIDWAQEPEQLQPIIDRINALVLKVEECDPWVEKNFGVKGTGEGLVFYPISSAHCSYKSFGDLGFKAKGEKHSVVAHTKPVQADPTVVASAQAFAELVIAPARLEQAVRTVSGGELQFDMKNMGAFLKWIMNDVSKETVTELEASGLDTKIAAKACSERARNWFIEQSKK